MTVRIPKYRHHKGSGQALVQIRGERIYLGRHGTAESREKYRRLITEYLARDQESSTPTNVATFSGGASPDLSVNELILAYYRFARGYYVKDGKPTDETAGIRAVLKRLRPMYGRTRACDFGPRDFKLVRQAMVQDGLSRMYIEGSMARIKRMFRWAASEELLPVAIYQALSTVPGLRKGRSEAREPAPVLPVDEETVQATLPHLPPVVAEMVRLQRLTGCRPGEVCKIRPCDFDTSGEVWSYRPESHKNVS